MSVTYGAGGTTRERTHDLVVGINRDTSMTAMAHLTCAAHTRAELVEIVDAVPRRRDREHPRPRAATRRRTSTSRRASSTTRSISSSSSASVGDFSIGVAAHPEPHPRSASRRERPAPHRREAGARPTSRSRSSSSTPGHYFDLVETLRALGVDKPVIAGIMPATSLGSIKRMSEMQGSEFPRVARREAARGRRRSRRGARASASTEATKLCQTLLDGGAPGLHFYTLNRSTATREIYEQLGLGRRLTPRQG